MHSRSITWELFGSWLAVIAVLASSNPMCANDSLFETTIAPIFSARCLACHNEVDRKGSLSLETRSSALSECDSGWAIVPGKPESSLLLDYVTGPQPEMPKQDDPLSDREVAALRNWIAAGAKWPASVKLEVRDTWWSRQPPSRPEIPNLAKDLQPLIRTPIDAFVLAKLQAENMQPSPECDARTLARRLYYDLIGLPPTPEQTADFQKLTTNWHEQHPDQPPDVLPQPIVEQLVDKLLASPQYGERWARHWLDVVKYADTCGYDKDKLRPNAWPYRDYVIRSFNEDKPYARFVREQVAGDVLYPGTPDGILGLGFIAAGPWDFIGHAELPESKIDGKIARHLDRDDMVANTLNTFCSVTIQCARCHDHKFDPISQEHYYGLQAVFAAVDRADRPFDKDNKLMVYAAATEFPSQGTFHATGGKPRTVQVLHRGNVLEPAGVAFPGALPLPHQQDPVFELAAEHHEADRRAALAHWITSADNPLTWRSIVNRVWQYHFGRAIVDSPNDFGRMGQRPTHPQLLDWLAVEFRDNGQSFKKLHRLIVTSRTYRQSSTFREHNAIQDGDNRYLWRMNRRRLEAEEIRDSTLAISGRLDPAMGGPGYYLFELEKEEHSPHYEYHKFDPNDAKTHRRSIYRFVVRSQPDPYMTTLDCADSSQSTPKRSETLNALQSLSLLNNRFNLAMAKHFADRVATERQELADQVSRAFHLAAARQPTDEELKSLVTFSQEFGLENTCRVILNLNEFLYLD